MSDPDSALQSLNSVRARTIQRLDELTQEQLNWRPPGWHEGRVSENAWSLGEIFMHLALDEHYLREQIARPLLEGVKPPDDLSFLPPPPPYGMTKQVIRFWFDRARAITRRLLENLPADANLELQHMGGLEPMNGLEWLLGYAGHEASHHRQMDALIAQGTAANWATV